MTPRATPRRITISNVLQSNGVIHVIDNVVQPN